jgi:hypothetical protein
MLVAAGSANAAYQIQRVLAEGDPAPVPGALNCGCTATFSTFGPLQINDASDMAFIATVVDGVSPVGVFRRLANGDISSVMVAGFTAPGTGNGVYNNFSDVSMNASGEVVFHAEILGGSVAEGIFLASGGVIAAVALPGDPAPGTGGTYQYFYNVHINAAGDVTFYAGVAGGSVDEGIFVDSGGPDSALFLPGQVAPGTGGQTVTDIVIASGYNDAGEVGMTARLSGGQSGAFRVSSGAVELLSLHGDAAPGTGGGTLDFSSFAAAEVYGDNVVVWSPVSGGTTGFGLFLASDGTLAPLLFQDAVAPGTGGGTLDTTGAGLGLNASGKMAATVPVDGGTVGVGIFSNQSGVLRDSVLPGDAEPEGAGTFDGFGKPSIDASGAIYFVGFLTGTPVTQGIYLATPPLFRLAEVSLSFTARSLPTLTPIDTELATLEVGVSSGTDLQQVEIPSGLFGNLQTSSYGQSVVASLGTGTIQRTGVGFRGTVPVDGTHSFSGFHLSFSMPPGQLGVGGTGGIISTFGGLSVNFGTFHTGSITLLSGTDDATQNPSPVIAMGFAHGPASLTSTLAQPSGVLQLVSPTQATVGNFLAGSFQYTPHLTRLTIRFVPEPGALLALSGGALCVAGLGWRRSRRGASPTARRHSSG